MFRMYATIVDYGALRPIAVPIAYTFGIAFSAPPSTFGLAM